MSGWPSPLRLSQSSYPPKHSGTRNRPSATRISAYKLDSGQPKRPRQKGRGILAKWEMTGERHVEGDTGGLWPLLLLPWKTVRPRTTVQWEALGMERVDALCILEWNQYQLRKRVRHRWQGEPPGVARPLLIYNGISHKYTNKTGLMVDQPINYGDCFAIGPISISQYLVVHSQVFEAFNDCERGTRDNRFDRSRRRLIIRQGVNTGWLRGR